MTIAELYIYPIKSLGGISLTEAVVEAKGLRYDRRFMLVEPDGTFITQRSNHQMALIDVQIQENRLRVWHRHQPEQVLELPLTLPDQPSDQSRKWMHVTIWDSNNVPALVVSEEADRWFSDVLKKPCRLVFMPETTQRPVDPDYAREHDLVSFADGYPYLLIGQASLDTLNQRLAEPITMQRFRPNIVVADSQPYEEDAWSHFRIGGVDFYGVKPCARCVLTTIDPATAQTGREPLRTLSTYRQWKHKILFGQNVLAKPTGASVLGTLRVGQSVEVIERQKPWLDPPVQE